MRAALRLALAFAVVALAATAAAAPARALAPGERVVIDDFEDAAAWSAQPASGVKLAIGSDAGVHGRALRLDFDFGGGGGYAVARRAVSIDVPENYRFRFAVRGECLPNDLEFKLVDASGDNVWWMNRRGFRFPAQWDSLSTKKRQITFAWGPKPGELRHVASIEFAITAGSGGKGTVWLDDLTLEALPAPSATPPKPHARASSVRPGHGAALAIDRAPATFWSSAPGDSRPWLELELVEEREFGGLVIDWAPNLGAADYVVEISSDGRSWHALREVHGGNGGKDALQLPESEARRVRIRALRASGARGIAIREITIEPLEWGATAESFFQSLASGAPRGSYPRGMRGEQPYWTIVGLDADKNEALLGEDGNLETGKAQFSMEPFLEVGDTLVTWADVEIEQTLDRGDMPMPKVTWRRGDLELHVTAFAVGSTPEFEHAAPGNALRALAGDGSAVVARYRVINRASRPARVALDLAIRPFQVNPPTQFLNTRGGTTSIKTLAREGPVLRVNGERGVVSLTPPSGFGAATFDEGDVVEHLRLGRLPRATHVSDPFEHASGALRYMLDLPANGAREVSIAFPFEGVPGPGATALDSTAVAALEAASRKYWDARVRPVTIELPAAADEVGRTVRAQIGWILINRDGPAIQPGSRSYERSWIRDGSLTSSALLRMGHAPVVREFLEWFAERQYEDGKVPCCVDARGADPVPEHDSSGELIFAIAEYHRYTGDRAFVERLWPRVVRAAAYLDSLRGLRRTPEWRTPAKREFFGLLPPSISHEGYSAKPMHSYWDDLFALRGFKDVVYLAGVIGNDLERFHWMRVRDEFQRDLTASIRAAMVRHKIDYIPGAADLGDFDATSTTIALDPVQAALPAATLNRTFEKYWTFFRDRRDGRERWDAMTPYETRTIGAFVQLGWRDRANEALEWFMTLRRPKGWAQWAEVVGMDARQPRFIGDMPHTWVGSDFVRSVLDMFAYERESDSALVVGAGVPLTWVKDAPGVSVRGLHTPHGTLDLTMRMSGDSTVVTIGGDLRVPRGGIVVRAPVAKPVRRVMVNGVATSLRSRGEVVVRRVPATVVLRP